MTDQPSSAEPEPEPEPAIPDDLRLKLPVPTVSIVLIALNLAAFAITAARGSGWMVPDPDKLVAMGGNLPALTLHGEPWRLVTAMFLHAGFIHVAMNMLCLWGGGQSAEFMFGRRSFLAIYLSAGLVGGIASAARGTMIVSVGASGAVFGVFGAILGYLIAHRTQLEPTVRAKRMKSLVSFVGINLLVGISVAGVDLSAHIGGFAAGFLIAVVAERGLDLQDRARSMARRFPRVLVGLALSLAVVGVGLVALPKPALAYITGAEGKQVAEFERQIKLFATNEVELLARQDELTKNTVKSANEIARIIDEELLPRWRAHEKNFAGITDLPAVMLPRQRAAVAYLHARVDYLEAVSAGLKLDPNSPEVPAARTALAAREQAVVDALAALKKAFE
ncbi:MAG: rhomboid family intramembrane serine protease [Myxococcales bacterium]|nr:rhomboid family intramembrane serine protease [Myxococcales bacterium]